MRGQRGARRSGPASSAGREQPRGDHERDDDGVVRTRPDAAARSRRGPSRRRRRSATRSPAPSRGVPRTAPPSARTYPNGQRVATRVRRARHARRSRRAGSGGRSPSVMRSCSTRWNTLVVVGLDRDGVAQERPRGAVGGAELAEEVVAPGEQALEERRAGAAAARSSARRPRLALAALERVGDQVRLALPGAVEPVEEDLDLGRARRVGREQRRVGEALARGGAGCASSR